MEDVVFSKKFDGVTYGISDHPNGTKDGFILVNRRHPWFGKNVESVREASSDPFVTFSLRDQTTSLWAIGMSFSGSVSEVDIISETTNLCHEAFLAKSMEIRGRHASPTR